MCANPEIVEPDLKSVSCGVQDEGPPQTNAHATSTPTPTPIQIPITVVSVSVSDDAAAVNITEKVTTTTTTGNLLEDTTIKKRKTRRGKSKRRNPNPYTKLSWQQRKNMCNRNKFRANILNHALAPFNSNQFLMEDHGDLQELDDKLNKSDGAAAPAAGTSTTNPPPRTRDSSFSVDSDGDFYSSPEDEEEFLTKEFDTAYENLQAERLQSMSKAELIEEYLQLENKVELLTKRLRGKSTTIAAITTTTTNEDDAKKEPTATADVQEEINKLIVENDELRRENEHLRSGMCRTASSFSSSMDSESDSSSSTCNSSSTAASMTNQGDEVMKEDVVMENGVHSSPTSTINDKSPTLSIEQSSSLIDNVL